jgi:hypothetical protein
MYSAAANETALDRLPGNDPVQNSVYMRLFLPLMRRANFSLPDLAQELRRQVREMAASVGHVQRPAYYDGLVGRFCLSGCDEQTGTSPTLLNIPGNPEKAWEWFSNTESEEALLAYIDKFRGTEPSKLAARKLDLLQRKKTVLHILSIGVSDYADPKLKLRYAGKDAVAVASTLETSLGPSYRAVQTTTLLDRQATRNQIEHAFEMIRSNAAPNDTVVVYLSGHGFNSEGQPYFITFDTEFSDNISLARTAVNLNRMQEILAAAFGRRLLFLDVDVSGLVQGDFQNTRAEQITVFSAAKPGQFSQESAAVGHGVFTAALLEGLRGKAASKEAVEISVTELGRYIEGRVTELSRGSQIPLVFTDEPNAILGRRTNDAR